MAKEKPICHTCGSDNVRKDAYAVWNEEKQEWELDTTYDDTACMDCENSCKLDWIEIS